MQSQRSTDKVTIDVRYPRKYEDATDIVDLLAGNESILIDFQYMTESSSSSLFWTIWMGRATF